MQQQRRRPPVALSPVNNSIRSTRRSMPSTASPCFGCSQPMYNQFLSNVLDHLWHPECVRCIVCRCSLNEQCYSREGKLYCKDDFIKKYIHRCFACQNLVQSHEFIRRIRAGRIYHAECFVCSKCKRTLQDEDIASLLKSDDTTLNDLDCLCQTCANPNKSSAEILSLTNGDKDKTMENEIPNTINGKASPPEEKPSTITTGIPQSTNDTAATENHVNEQQQSMDVDETKPAISPKKERSPSPPILAPTKSTGRQSKVRQSTSSNGSKRSPTKSKVTTPVSRQKQTTATERKGRSPATRSKSSAVTPPTSSAVQTRSSNRRTTKSTRYRKRSFSSGSDEEETENDEEEDDDDTDFTEEDHIHDDEQDHPRSKPSTNSEGKKPEPDSVPPPPPPPPPSTATNPSLLSQAKMSEPLSLLSGLAANPMSISSIMKPDLTPSFMPPNFNPAFPTHPQFLPPGFSLQPRLPIPSQLQSASVPDSNRSTHSANASDTDSLDRSSSPSQMDVSTIVEPGTPARQAPPSTTTQKPSALSSLLEFGTLPPSTLGDIRSTSASANPFPFPFVTPGPGVPFSPQAAAGMATFYRPPFGVPPSTMPLDMTQSNSSKKKSDTTENEEKISQNFNDDFSSSSSPKKKARKSTSRSKAKTKKNGNDDENRFDEDNTSSPPPPPPPTNKKKKKLKSETTENGSTNDKDETKVTNGNPNNHSHNLLAQMGLINNSFMPPPLPSSPSTNGKTPTPNSQQAQLAAMYNMAPHFAAYNAFPGAFNPAFAAAAYASGYPSPYGFHPAFGASPTGQPFPFMTPTSSSNVLPLNNDDKSSSIVVPETRPAKSRSKSNTGGEKKKATTPRSNKKKAAAAAAAATISADPPAPTEVEGTVEPIPQVATTPESTSTPTKRRMSGTESEDFDEQQHSQTTNGKSGNESDGSIGDGDRSLNTLPSTSSSTALEKKGARTTIKPQQLEALCKAYDVCSKPNKAQREQLVAETGLSLRVIQVWFQNKRSKERKGKPSREKETALDDDELGDDSQPSPPPVTSEPTLVVTDS